MKERRRASARIRTTVATGAATAAAVGLTLGSTLSASGHVSLDNYISQVSGQPRT